MWARFHLTLAAVCASCCFGSVIDRVAVVVGSTVITQTEVVDEVRLSALESGQPFDEGPAARRAAAERLVDQQLLRNEMEISGFDVPPPSAADALLKQFRQEHFPAPEKYQAALSQYGVAEDGLKKHLLWELTAIKFTDVRFRMGLPAPPESGADRTQTAGAAPAAKSVDEQLDAWLKDARTNTKVVFKQEAFQ